MLTASGPKVLEFNCRLGDPETQAILLRFDDNLAEIARDAADGVLSTPNVKWRKEAVACVVLAAKGYPATAHKGDEITGIDEAMSLSGVTVYHAGTRRDNDRLVTSGGRVLSVCGRGATLRDALSSAYDGVEKIHFEGMWYRTDIGQDTIKKLENFNGGS
jgi:phosphoribosylamine--glycine ligase